MQALSAYKYAMGVLGTRWANDKTELRDRFSMNNVYSVRLPFLAWAYLSRSPVRKITSSGLLRDLLKCGALSTLINGKEDFMFGKSLVYGLAACAFSSVFHSSFSLAQALRTEVYRGSFVDKQENQYPCSLEVSYDEKNNIAAVNASGKAKTWAVLAETSSGYRPESKTIDQHESQFTKDVEQFKRLKFSWSRLGSGFRLTSTVKPASSMKGNIVLEFATSSSGHLMSYTEKFDVYVFQLVPFARTKLVCSNLRRVR
jgi:hypothetical protein